MRLLLTGWLALFLFFAFSPFFLFGWVCFLALPPRGTLALFDVYPLHFQNIRMPLRGSRIECFDEVLRSDDKKQCGIRRYNQNIDSMYSNLCTVPAAKKKKQINRTPNECL